VIGAVRLIDCCGGSRDRITSTMSAISDQGGERIRRAVLWKLVADESSRATQALSLIASRADDPRSAVAARECDRRQRRAGVALPRKTTQDGSHPVGVALNRFIEEHDRLSAQERSSLTEQFKSLGPDLARQLERKLDSSRNNTLAATLRAVRTFDLVTKLLPQIYRCAHDPDALVRSTALGLLDQDHSPTAVRLLRDALNDVDSRVQAAAIEALEHLGIEKVCREVRAKFESRNNRVRANAIKALWNTEIQNAMQALETMLKDTSSDHRLSALWVVERVKLRSIMELLEAMSRSDPDPRIRARAIRVLGRVGATKELV
jgi:HEAT repeat protein